MKWSLNGSTNHGWMMVVQEYELSNENTMAGMDYLAMS